MYVIVITIKTKGYMIMKTNLIMTVGLVAMLGICGTAIDAKEQNKDKGKSTYQEVKDGAQHQAKKARHAKFYKMLQEKYPEEMKEIKALREAAKAKLKALKQKAKADHKALRKAAGKGKKMGYLKEKYPEEIKEILELRKTDKKAAKAKLKALRQKVKAEHQARRKAAGKGKDK
jgi:hypothetical protein